MNNDNDILVKVEGLSKKFCKDLKTSLWYGVKDLIYGVRGNTHERELRPKEFWAVKDVSFELRRGECLGLIGHNGAGKSTLLKILNGLINPDAGKVTITGRVGALIELGAGFNPILSGRENIYNNGAILGFSKKEIDTKIQTIIDFAELEEFIDMPVQNYSSGMKVRLGFAVAAQMEPDVLIIDEVLAVGDLGFVLKCYKTIDTILPKTAMIFVSHSMPMVSRICNEIILMDKGTVAYQGKDVGKGIDLYYSRFIDNGTNVVFSDGSLKLVSAQIRTGNLINGLTVLNWKDTLKVYFKFNVSNVAESTLFLVSIFDKEQRPVAILKENDMDFNLKVKDGFCEFVIEHQNLQLSKGVYNMNISVSKGRTKEPILRINNVLQFLLSHDEDVWPPFLLDSKFNIV